MSINHRKSKYFYFAHRGAPWVKDENTVSSFNKAIDLGCQGIEMDIQKLSRQVNLELSRSLISSDMKLSLFGRLI